MPLRGRNSSHDHSLGGSVRTAARSKCAALSRISRLLAKQRLTFPSLAPLALPHGCLFRRRGCFYSLGGGSCWRLGCPGHVPRLGFGGSRHPESDKCKRTKELQSRVNPLESFSSCRELPPEVSMCSCIIRRIDVCNARHLSVDGHIIKIQ